MKFPMKLADIKAFYLSNHIFHVSQNFNVGAGTSKEFLD